VTQAITEKPFARILGCQRFRELTCLTKHAVNQMKFLRAVSARLSNRLGHRRNDPCQSMHTRKILSVE
jgi:hypothetical protein